MVTQIEEQQAKDFLKRAEIRTMRKDLLALREVDALKERDKIAKIKTIEEQRAEERQKLSAKEAQKTAGEKADLAEFLQRNQGQERLAEKDLKSYATEEERQKIFLLESERLNFEKQIQEIDEKKDPELKLQNNKLLLLKRAQQEKLDLILEEEKKLEGEQKAIIEKEQTTTIPAERKGLEQARWDLDKKIQAVEKKRWEAEKGVQEIEIKISQLDKATEQLTLEKNILRDKVMGADRSLREIYSVIMAREEEKIKGKAQEQIARKEALSKVRLEEKENVQRREWSPAVPKKDNVIIPNAPISVRQKILSSAKAEEDQRKQFLKDIENWSNKNDQEMQTLSPIVPVPSARRSPVMPPPPIKK